MKLRLQLSDVDRERFGAPEWMDLDIDVVSFAEVIAMQKGFTVEDEPVGFDSANEWRVAWFGHPVLDDKGDPVMLPVVDAEGNPELDDEGKQKQVVKRVGDWGAVLVSVWLALRRAGIRRPLSDVADCDPERVRMEIMPDDADETGPGKDDSGAATTS